MKKTRVFASCYLWKRVGLGIMMGIPRVFVEKKLLFVKLFKKKYSTFFHSLIHTGCVRHSETTDTGYQDMDNTDG